jgi:hypothetical protein
MALATGRCEIRAGCYVPKIVTDGKGRATGAVYFDERRREIRRRALANSNGLVGKYLMFDSGAFCGGVFEQPLNFSRSMYLLSHSTTLPVEQNSISLDLEVKDEWDSQRCGSRSRITPTT